MVGAEPSLDRNEGFFHPSILSCFAMESPYGSSVSFLPLDRNEVCFGYLVGYSFRMGHPSGLDLLIGSRVKELLQLGSWERFFRPVLRVSLCHPLVGRPALKRGGFHILLSSLLARTVCIPLTNEGVGLGPSSSGPVASRPPLSDWFASAASR